MGKYLQKFTTNTNTFLTFFPRTKKKTNDWKKETRARARAHTHARTQSVIQLH